MQVPESRALQFAALEAPRVVDDKSYLVGTAVASALSDIGKGIITGYTTARDEKAALEKEERDHLRKLEIELLKQQRYDEAERKRDERLDKTIRARLTQVGADKAAKRVRFVDEEEDTEENLGDTVPYMDENVPSIYKDDGSLRDQGDVPLEPLPEEDEENNLGDGAYGPVVPMEGGPIRMWDNPPPPLAPEEGGMRTEDYPELSLATPDFGAIPPEYLLAQAGGVPPAAPVDQLPLKDMALDLQNVSVNYVTPQQDLEMRQMQKEFRQSLGNALLDKAKREAQTQEIAQTGEENLPPLATVPPVGAQPAPTKLKPGPYKSYENAMLAASVPPPPGYAPAEVKDVTENGKTYFVVEPFKRLTEKEAKEEKSGGGKPMTSSEVKDLADLDGVLSTLNVIEKKLSKIEQRGPIVGPFRAAVPYDVAAQEIENLATSITPGLARGVFGEVGVLTDQDIARYKALIPNIKTDARVAEANLRNLREKIAVAKKEKIETFRQAGYDVSGFEEEYKKLSETPALVSSNINEQIRSQVSKLKSIKAKKGTENKEYSDEMEKLIELRTKQKELEESE